MTACLHDICFGSQIKIEVRGDLTQNQWLIAPHDGKQQRGNQRTDVEERTQGFEAKGFYRFFSPYNPMGLLGSVSRRDAS